jgi:ABC transporter substrate binding protein
MRRRHFITLLGGAAAWPLAARAQQLGKVARIGFLGAASASGYASQVEGFRLGLRDLGYIEGRNIVIEYRWAEGKYERLPELAADLIRSDVDVIVTHGTPGSLAAKQVTATIPIVMAAIGDPVATGIVTSVSRPSGNITGLSFFNPELNAKRIELLKEVMPRITHVAVLINADNPAGIGPELQAMETAARLLKNDTPRVHHVADRRQGRPCIPAGPGQRRGVRGNEIVDESPSYGLVPNAVAASERGRGASTISWTVVRTSGGHKLQREHVLPLPKGHQRGLSTDAAFEWFAPQILAVKFEQVEGAQDYVPVIATAAHRKHRHAVVIATHRLAIDQA